RSFPTRRSSDLLIKQKIPMPARVQPNVEGAGIIFMFLAIALLPLAPAVAAVCLGIVGCLVLIRMWRWQLWHCADRIDLLLLAAGYAWLGIGLIDRKSTRLNSSHVSISY